MSSRLQTALIWMLLVVLGLGAFTLATWEGGGGGSFPGGEGVAGGMDTGAVRAEHAADAPEISLEDMVALADEGMLTSLVYDDDGSIFGRRADGAWVRLRGGWDEASAARLTPYNIPFEPLYYPSPVAAGQPESVLDDLSTLICALLALLGLLLGLLAWARRYQKNAGGLLKLRNSPARTLEAASHLKFADVGGLDEIKSRLQDIISLLREPEAWTAAGVRLPRGVLLEGPPGCGKTLLARAVAGEADVPVFVISATDLVEMFIGVGAARVRDTFEKARAEGPAVLFIDELDAVGRRRGSGATGTANDEREQTLNQLLVSLDGAEQHDADGKLLVVMAATNRADILDPALLRPGRFDLRLIVQPPDRAGRRGILGVHTRRLELAGDVDLDAVAEGTEGMTGAELELAVNEAALRAARRRFQKDGVFKVTAADLSAGLLTVRATVPDFDAVDALMVESATQLSRPRGAMRLRLTVEGLEAPLTGRLLWADPSWIKLADADNDDAERLIPKIRVLSIESLEGTASVDPGSLPPPPSPIGVA